MSDRGATQDDRRSALERGFQRLWYGGSPWAWLLSPFSLLYYLLVSLRRLPYALGLRRAMRGAQPVVVVGNLTVGGSGKTPLVIWLVEALARRGLRAAVVSRGYGGYVGLVPLRVERDTDPARCGDEPLLFARRTGTLVVVHPDRVLALLSIRPEEADIVIADDGLQHLPMARDFEILVRDGVRGFGNRLLLPAGPMREPAWRTAAMDAIVTNGGDGQGLTMRLEPIAFVRPADGRREVVASWAGRRIRALAGIGDPARFFGALTQLGLTITQARTLPDHARLGPDQLSFDGDEPVVMTEKDAVRAGARLGEQHWYLEIGAALYDAAEADAMLDRMLRIVAPGTGREVG